MSSDQEHEGSDVWNDFTQGYIPPDHPDVHSNLTLSREYESDLDITTYEVLRHRLYTINYEHGETVTQISGSPVVYYAQDFNPSILSAEGEIVFGGPYIDFFTPMSEPIVKWMLENYSDGSPGIEPGDVFLNNDPWIGAAHQNDVSMCMPVFHDDELFCWLIDTLHQYDVGGETPGSFCSNADDIYDDPTPIPPIKIVENDEVREDLKYMYLRHSRMPDMVSLDFGAQLAALRDTRGRIKDLIENYGHKTVKGAMHRVIDDSEKAFLERIRQIPDGTWRSKGYETGPKVGGTKQHLAAVTLTKEGDTLKFSTEGTDPNEGVVNIPYANFRAAISTVFNPLMLYDQLWVPSGAYRHIEIEPNPGSRYHAEHPSAVSASSSQTIHHAISQIHDAATRMMYTSDIGRQDIISDQSNGQGTVGQSGIDQWGNEFGTINLDAMGTAFPARDDKDGVDAGGHLLSPKGFVPNIEENEQDYPILYLNRTPAKDAAGHGKFRGGAGMEATWISHNTGELETSVHGTGDVAPITMGNATYPGAPARPRAKRDTNIEARLADGEIPTTLDEVKGDLEVFPTKAETYHGTTDVFEMRYSSCAGYADPLERAPEMVAEDVKNDLVSTEVARDIYGVVLTDSSKGPAIDEQATERRREEIRQERLDGVEIPADSEEE
jgi:N-methylhydantoinase B